jgi:hypothetical protein
MLPARPRGVSAQSTSADRERCVGVDEGDGSSGGSEAGPSFGIHRRDRRGRWVGDTRDPSSATTASTIGHTDILSPGAAARSFRELEVADTGGSRSRWRGEADVHGAGALREVAVPLLAPPASFGAHLGRSRRRKAEP